MNIKVEILKPCLHPVIRCFNGEITKECLIDFLRNEQKQMNIMFYCNDFEFADRLFKLIKNNVADMAM